MMSLHAYICRKSYKKLDLSPTWAKDARERLTPDFASALDEAVTDSDWKITCLLVYLCPNKTRVEDFFTWLDSLTTGDLYEIISEYSSQFPDNMAQFRMQTLSMFMKWNEQYFKHLDPRILVSLRAEEGRRNDLIQETPWNEFIDQTTNGMLFEPINGLERLVLIPQYHFQPINFICYYGKMTICHYAARIHLNDDGFISPHDYRVIRSLAEKSRLKIPKYLHQGPRSFIEIARHLELSKGIAHDHISKLRSAGMIYAHVVGETVTEYSLRSKALQQMQNSLLAYIEKD